MTEEINQEIQIKLEELKTILNEQQNHHKLFNILLNIEKQQDIIIQLFFYYI